MAEKLTANWVYTGRVRLKGDKLGYCYRPLKDDGTPEDEAKDRVFAKPLDRFAHVGAVYAVTCTRKEDNSTTVEMGQNAPSYTYKYPDAKKIAEWEGHSVSEEGLHAALKSEKKDFADKEIDKLLLPLRRAMQQTNYLGQRILAAKVLGALFKPVYGDKD